MGTEGMWRKQEIQETCERKDRQDFVKDRPWELMGEEESVLTPTLGSWTLAMTLLKQDKGEEKLVCKRRFGHDFALVEFHRSCW